MKDYKATSTMQAKRERAIGLLKALGIWRGQSDCKHQYKDSKGQNTNHSAAFSVDHWDGLNHG